MPGPVTSIDDLTTELAMTSVGWDKPRWDRFVSDLSPQEQALEVQMLADSAQAPPTSAWSTALVLLSAALTIAGAVAGIGGAVQAVQGVVRNARGAVRSSG